jgi:hypothetical protein
MTKLTGAALDRAVAHAMGLKSVHNCEKWRGAMDKDDDIQDYKKPWVGLTDEERKNIWTADQMTAKEWDELFNTIEAKLKEKNT